MKSDSIELYAQTVSGVDRAERKVASSGTRTPLFKEGEVWWCYVGENVGIEVNGKGNQFTRPVFVFKKYDRYSFLGLPLSTKLKVGSWYAPVTFGGQSQIITLVQGRVLDYRRLKEKIGELDEQAAEKVRKLYFELHESSLKIDLPPFPAGVVGNPKYA